MGHTVIGKLISDAHCLCWKKVHVLCVSGDGFDETGDSESEDMIQETRKIEECIEIHCGRDITLLMGARLVEYIHM